MVVSKYYELNTFLGNIFEEWRIFDRLKDIPTIEANILPWIYALWFQVGVLCLCLAIWFLILKRESMRLNAEALKERNNTGTQDILERRKNRTDVVGSIAGLHEAVKKYYVQKSSVG